MYQVFYLIEGIGDKHHMGSFLKNTLQTSRKESQTGNYNAEKWMIWKRDSYDVW